MEAKRKPGRPATENPRNRKVGVWMNDVEYQQFLDAGGCAGVRKLLAQAAKEKASIDVLALSAEVKTAKTNKERKL